MALAAAVCAAVLSGSLVVGDSVRGSLEKRVRERLGRTETVIASQNGYLDRSFVSALGGEAEGLLYREGFVSRNGRLIPVHIWGCESVPEGKVDINAQLSRESGIAPGEAVVLRLEKDGLVPRGSLFVTEQYSASLRLICADVRSQAAGGGLSLRNEQELPLNVFVNRLQLCQLLELGDKINVVLAPVRLEEGDIASRFGPPDAGIQVREGLVTSESVFLPGALTAALAGKAECSFSYLANRICTGDREIPYSFVTAVESWKGTPLARGETLLSDYAANRLGARVGDQISLSYYVSTGLKQLREDTLQVRVAGIVPLSELSADPFLKADFPGLAQAERCTDWDSDLPIDMDRITPADEDFWTAWKNTPKLLLSYAEMAARWASAYGHATAARLPEGAVLPALGPSELGIQVLYPRESGLTAARSGVDFGGLFLALGCFILVAALLLLLNPLQEMYAVRRGEFATLRGIGFDARRIRSLLLQEGFPVVAAGSSAGVLAGLLYAALLLFLLGNVWKGATHTDGFQVFPQAGTLVMAFAGSLLLSFLMLLLALRGLSRESGAHQVDRPSRALPAALAATVLLAVLLITNLALWQSVVVFVLVGTLWMAACTLWLLVLLSRGEKARETGRKGLILATLHAGRGRVMLSFVTLSLGVFIVFAVGLNRSDFSNGAARQAATGGFDSWCETSVPVYYNLSTPEGLSHMNLGELPAPTEILQLLRSPGDDASCLNLNKVTNPPVLGVEMDRFLAHFQPKKVLPELEGRLPEALSSGRYALVDETVLLWGLGLQLGDTLHYSGSRGETAGFILAGLLPDTVFQGSLLVDRSVFAATWPEITGSTLFLSRSGLPEEARDLYLTALNEYGIRVTPTLKRLELFNSVTDTYLSIFLALGGIGLLLGLFSLLVVLRKNLAARREDIRLLRQLGFRPSQVEELLTRENLPVPLLAVLAGVSGALVSILSAFGNVSAGIWLLCLVLTILLLAGVVWAVKAAVRRSLEIE